MAWVYFPGIGVEGDGGGWSGNWTCSSLTAIDIDWEYPYGETENADFLTLMQTLREELDAIKDGKRYVLTIAGPAITRLINNMQLSELKNVLDWINGLFTGAVTCILHRSF